MRPEFSEGFSNPPRETGPELIERLDPNLHVEYGEKAELPPPPAGAMTVDEDFFDGGADEAGNDDAGRDGRNDARDERFDKDTAAEHRLANERLDVVRNELRDVQQMLRETLAPDPDQVQMTRELLVSVRLLRSTVQDLVEMGRDQDPRAASAVVAQASVIQSDLTTASKWGAVWQRVRDAFERALPRLWALISRLVRVKEWTVTGQVKSDPFGLLGASISITFGG